MKLLWSIASVAFMLVISSVFANQKVSLALNYQRQAKELTLLNKESVVSRRPSSLIVAPNGYMSNNMPSLINGFVSSSTLSQGGQASPYSLRIGK
jgi:hypothetical protein